MAPDDTRLFAWLPPLRAAAAGLQALAFGNLLALAASMAQDVFAPGETERAPLPALVKRIFFFSLLPGLSLLVLRRLAAATARIEGGRLLLAFFASGERLEVPLASIARLRPLRLPLPDAGFVTELRSHNRLPFTLTLANPAPLAARLDPAADFRDAAAKARLRHLHHAAIKFGLFPAAVTFVLFRLHQLITYGGLFGEIDQLGLASWARTLLGVLLYVLAHLLVLSACLRALVELLALPRRPGLRLLLEAAAATAYYGLVAAVLILRLSL